MCAVAPSVGSATLIFAKYSSLLFSIAAATQPDSQACIAAETRKETCSKYMCAVAHLQCSATLIFAK